MERIQLHMRTRPPLADQAVRHDVVPVQIPPMVGVVSAKLIGSADGPRRIVLRADGVSAFRKREERVYVKRYLGKNAKIRGLEGIAWIW